MLKIRLEQMEVFRREAEAKLARSLTGIMRQGWPKECEQETEAGLFARCMKCVSDAGRLGLRTDQAIARLMNLRFVFGDEFPNSAEHSDLLAILRNRVLSEPERLDYLWGRLLSRGGD